MFGTAAQNLKKKRDEKKKAKEQQQELERAKALEKIPPKTPLDVVLEAAVQAGLTEADLADHMKLNVMKGYFTEEYYVDMWVTRLEDANVPVPQEALNYVPPPEPPPESKPRRPVQDDEVRRTAHEASPFHALVVMEQKKKPSKAEKSARIAEAALKFKREQPHHSTADDSAGQSTALIPAQGAPAELSEAELVHERLRQAIASAKEAGVSEAAVAVAEGRLRDSLEREAQRQRERTQLEIFNERLKQQVQEFKMAWLQEQLPAAEAYQAESLGLSRGDAWLYEARRAAGQNLLKYHPAPPSPSYGLPAPFALQPPSMPSYNYAMQMQRSMPSYNYAIQMQRQPPRMPSYSSASQIKIQDPRQSAYAWLTQEEEYDAYEIPYSYPAPRSQQLHLQYRH